MPIVSGDKTPTHGAGLRFRRYHAYIVIIIGLSIVFDGFDTYAFGLALPSMAKEWGIKPGAFAGVTAMASIATIAGAAIAGFLGDRIGRKRTLILATATYGGGSLISALSSEMTLLAASRVITAIGLGGAIVAAIVSIAEHVPPRQRSAAIAMATLAIPLGHTLAGVTATLVIEPLGWRSMFLIGAAVPGIMVLLQVTILPETPSFMQGKPQYRAALERYCRRTGADPDDLGQPSSGRTKSAAGRFAALFSGGYRGDTLFLWAGISATVFITHVSSQWLPSLISHAGGSVTEASQAITYFGIGQILGAFFATALIYRYGSRRPMLGGAVVILALAAILMAQFDTHPTAVATFMVFALMACVGSQMVALHHALGPAVYPEHIRGTGTGLALAVGKSGGLISSFAGAWALDYGGYAFFGLIAVAAATQFVCFGMIKRHAPSGRASTLAHA